MLGKKEKKKEKITRREGKKREKEKRNYWFPPFPRLHKGVADLEEVEGCRERGEEEKRKEKKGKRKRKRKRKKRLIESPSIAQILEDSS